MKVSELIEKLKEMPQDFEACTYDYDCGYEEIVLVSVEKNDLSSKYIVYIG